MSLSLIMYISLFLYRRCVCTTICWSCEFQSWRKYKKVEGSRSEISLWYWISHLIIILEVNLDLYVIVCKPSVAHGSKMAHQVIKTCKKSINLKLTFCSVQMSIVFHEGAVKGCEPPCVAQTFIPHDAVLFKIFVVGKKHFVVERPSLKNFYAAGK